MLRAVQFGFQTGLRVSELCLGTMNFGIPGRGHQGDWTLDYKEAKKMFPNTSTCKMASAEVGRVIRWKRPQRAAKGGVRMRGLGACLFGACLPFFGCADKRVRYGEAGSVGGEAGRL